MKYVRTFFLAMLGLVAFGLAMGIVLSPLYLAGYFGNEAWLLLWIPIFGVTVAFYQWCVDDA